MDQCWKVEDYDTRWVLVTPPPGADIEFQTAGVFRSVIDRVVGRWSQDVIVDFHEINFLDSSGLGLLIALYKELRDQDRHLLVITNEVVDNILALTRLRDIFDTADELPIKEGVA